MKKYSMGSFRGYLGYFFSFTPPTIMQTTLLIIVEIEGIS